MFMLATTLGSSVFEIAPTWLPFDAVHTEAKSFKAPCPFPTHTVANTGLASLPYHEKGTKTGNLTRKCVQTSPQPSGGGTGCQDS